MASMKKRAQGNARRGASGSTAQTAIYLYRGPTIYASERSSNLVSHVIITKKPRAIQYSHTILYLTDAYHQEYGRARRLPSFARNIFDADRTPDTPFLSETLLQREGCRTFLLPTIATKCASNSVAAIGRLMILGASPHKSDTEADGPTKDYRRS